MLTRLTALALLVVCAGTSFAATDQELYIKKWKKVAIDFNDGNTFTKPKMTCVCLDGTANNERLGVLAYSDTGPDLKMTCGLPEFSGTGDAIGMLNCSNYEVIGK